MRLRGCELREERSLRVDRVNGDDGPTARTTRVAVGLITAIATLLLLAALAGLSSASITGVQPPSSGDWVIDSNTTVVGENVTVDGNITVRAGNTLAVSNSNITVRTSSSARHGILVEAGGDLNVTRTTITANDTSAGYTLIIRGRADLHGSVILTGVHDGVRIEKDSAVTLSGVNILARGTHGVFVNASDPVIEDTTITTEDTVNGTWDGSTSQVTTRYGLAIHGSPGDLAAPTLRNVTILVQLRDEWNRSTTTNQVYERMTAYGLYAIHADLGTLEDINVRFKLAVDAELSSLYNTVRFEVHLSTMGLRISGDSLLDGMDGVVIDNSTYDVTARETRASNALMDIYHSMNGLLCDVSASGSVPSVLNGITVRDQNVSWSQVAFISVGSYPSGTAVYWIPHASAVGGSSMTVENVTVVDCDIAIVLYLAGTHDLTVRDCTVRDCILGSKRNGGYLLVRDPSISDLTFRDNIITGNTQMSGVLIPTRRQVGAFAITGNEFVGNNLTSVLTAHDTANTSKLEVSGNLFRDNAYSDIAWSFSSPGGPILFSMNNHKNEAYADHMVYIELSKTNLTMEEGIFRDLSGREAMVASVRMMASGGLRFEDNFVHNCTLEGIIDQTNAFGETRIVSNMFINSTFGDVFKNAHSLKETRVVDNNMLNNTMSRAFTFRNLNTADFTFERNQFTNNEAHFLVELRSPFIDHAIRWNDFLANDAVCIHVNETSESLRISSTVTDNTFINNTLYCIAYDDLNDGKVVVRGNKASGNGRYCLYLDNADPLYDGVETVEVTNNNFSFNPGGGIHLLLCTHDVQNGHSYGNPDQRVTVHTNALRGNGDKGWALYIAGLYRRPTITSNAMDGSVYGQYLELIEGDSRRRPFTVTYNDLDLDWGPKGFTAYGFCRVEADFYNCSFINFVETVYVKECNVSLWWCSLPGGSGKTEDRGRITVHNHLELQVDWANAAGLDSGQPVPQAVVAMRGANGKYLGAINADDEGHVDPFVVNPWTSYDGSMDIWTPFQVTTMDPVSSVSSNSVINLTMERTGANTVLLLILDHGLPEIIIVGPEDGAALNVIEVTVEGVVYETGSGLEVLEVRHSSLPDGMWIALATGGGFSHTFSGLDEGEYVISVRAADLAGNVVQVTVAVTVDLTPPDLDVRLQYLDGTAILYNTTHEGYFVQVDEVVLYGTYWDIRTELEDVVIRINGVVEPITTSALGKILKRIALEEGINTIIVDAMDRAGNRMSSRLYVTSDTQPPAITLFHPPQGNLTNDPWMEVHGLTEPNVHVRVVVKSSASTSTFEALSEMDGSFKVPVQLVEGIQLVSVEATDPAGNTGREERDVILDTEPPEFVISNPDKDYFLSRETRYTVIGTIKRVVGQPERIWLNGILMEGVGVFMMEFKLVEGVNEIVLTAHDEAGNVFEIIKVIEVDTVPPVLLVLSPENETILSDRDSVLFLGTSDDLHEVRVELVLDDRTVEAELVNGSWVGHAQWLARLELGPEYLELWANVTATDAAGNTAVVSRWIVHDSRTYSIEIERVPAKVDHSTLYINGTTIPPVESVSIEGVEYQVVPNGRFAIVLSLREGENDITVSIQDPFGNTYSKTIHVVYDPPGQPPGPPPEPETPWTLLAVVVVAIAVFAIVGFIYLWRKRVV